MPIIEELIKSQKWILAFEKSLALIAAFSWIEDGDRVKKDKEKFPDWLIKYAIAEFDNLANDYEELQGFKLNGKNVSSHQLQKISLVGLSINKKNEWKNSELSHILYKIRCSIFHSQTRIIQDIRLNGSPLVFELRVDEDNIFEQNGNSIYLNPIFFTNLIFCSTRKYIQTINSDQFKQDRYNKFCKYNSDLVSLILKIPPITMGFSVNEGKGLCFGLVSFIHMDALIEIGEHNFTFTCGTPSRLIAVNYAQIKSFRINNDKKRLEIDLNAQIDKFTSLFIDLNHPRRNELEIEINKKLNN